MIFALAFVAHAGPTPHSIVGFRLDGCRWLGSWFECRVELSPSRVAGRWLHLGIGEGEAINYAMAQKITTDHASDFFLCTLYRRQVSSTFADPDPCVVSLVEAIRTALALETLTVVAWRNNRRQGVEYTQQLPDAFSREAHRGGRAGPCLVPACLRAPERVVRFRFDGCDAGGRSCHVALSPNRAVGSWLNLRFQGTDQATAERIGTEHAADFFRCLAFVRWVDLDDACIQQLTRTIAEEENLDTFSVHAIRARSPNAPKLRPTKDGLGLRDWPWP